jgi:hypothetical protein
MKHRVRQFWDYACKAYYLGAGSPGKPLEPTKALKLVTATLYASYLAAGSTTNPSE